MRAKLGKRESRRATHMFRSRFGFYVQGATGECFCGCLEPPGGRDTSGRASVQHLQISVDGKGLTRLVRPIRRGCALLDPGRYSSALEERQEVGVATASTVGYHPDGAGIARAGGRRRRVCGRGF